MRVVRKNGQVFVIRPEKTAKSPLDVPGVKIDLTADAIVEIIREGRERYNAAGETAESEGEQR